MTDTFHFGTSPITCHAWNGDGSQVALCLNNNDVNIYEHKGSDYILLHTLRQHDLLVTGIDWAYKTNRIVTCAADRNAYVWNFDNGKWIPCLVLLRINRAATCVKWSPLENKFAVGSAANVISVCFFDEENDWWVSKHIKKPITSTILSIDWHPNNIMLVAGSTDFKVRVFSAWVKEVEPKPTSTPWGAKMSFGHLLTDISNSERGGGGWVHSVKFSDDGNKICWAGHDSSLSVVDATQNLNIVKILTKYLPFVTVTWVSHNRILAAGHQCVPVVYEVKQNDISEVCKLEIEQKKVSTNVKAMKFFQDKDLTGRGEQFDKRLSSVHQNTITGINILSKSKDRVSKLSTCGIDSQLVIWDMQSLEHSLKALALN